MIVNENILLDKLNGITVDETMYVLSENRQTAKIRLGDIEFFVASKYNPVKEGAGFAREKYDDKKNILLYGLGFGYHVQALVSMLQPGQTLYVVECNLSLIKLAFAHTDIKTCLEDERVVFLGDDSFADVIPYLRDVLQQEDLHVVIFEPSLRSIPTSLLTLKDMLEAFYFSTKSMAHFEDFMHANHAFNIQQGYENGGEVLYHYFAGKPLIIVCAGPSLEQNGHELKQVGDKALILCVGRGANFLHSLGVQPDFYVETESQNVYGRNYGAVPGTNPLFMLSTASGGLAQYPGKKYLLFQKTNEDLLDKRFGVESGGSVSTVALSLAVLMGCSPVVYMGQDLCYWSDHTHAQDTRGYEKVKTARTVQGIHDETYYAPTNLYMYLKWIERYIEGKKQTQFINSTAKGAHIHGMAHKSLAEVLAGLSDCALIKEYRQKNNTIDGGGSVVPRH